MERKTRLILLEGLYAGLIGYGVIVVFFSIFNVFSGRSVFHTAAVFGAALFYGLEDPALLEITPDAVLAFNMVHMIVLLGAGIFTAWMVLESEKHPVLQWPILVLILFVGFHLFAAVALLATPLLGELSWIPIAIASAAAGVAMGWFLIWRHPLLRRELRDIPMGDVPPAL